MMTMIVQQLVLATVLTACAAMTTQDVDAPPQKPAGAAAAAQDGGDCPVDESMRGIPADVDPAVDALLTTLEEAHKKLRSFEAKVTYERVEELLGRREIQTGELLVTRQPDTDDMRFALLFDVHMVGQLGGTLRREQKLNHYIFDGRWLAEIDHDRKQFIKRELVPLGQKLNPLKLGEGPIPLPVGQARDDVLRRFKVSETKLPEEGLLTQLVAAQVNGLRLVPRAGTLESEDYQSVDIFYDKSTHLPVGILAMLTTGDVKTVLLRDAAANPDWDEASKAKLHIQEPDPAEWDIDVVFWQGG